MSIAREVVGELRAMFVADARLTLGISALIALVGALIMVFGIDPLVAGVALLGGSIAILIAAVFHTAGSQASR
jgi:hypothetical protein